MTGTYCRSRQSSRAAAQSAVALCLYPHNTPRGLTAAPGPMPISTPAAGLHQVHSNFVSYAISNTTGISAFPGRIEGRSIGVTVPTG